MAFLQIISNNILPLLVFVTIGYMLDKKFNLDVKALNKLTFFVVLPSLIFYSVYSAKIDMTMITVFIVGCVEMFFLALGGTLYGKLRHFTPGKTEAFKNATMFSNTGNIGIALVALVFSNPPFVLNGETPYLIPAISAATMLLIQMNIFLNTLGLYQAGKGKLTPRDALYVIFHMPVVYVLVSVFTIKFLGIDMTHWFIWPMFQYSAQALVAIVMMALGMQMHHSRFHATDVDAWVAAAWRLFGGPLIVFCLLTLWNTWGPGFSPIVCQVIMIMACVPSPANSVLYAIEFQNYVDFATEIVVMSTVASVITMTLTIYLSQILFPVG